MGADFTPLGLAIGHATDEEGATGVTVVRGIDGPFRAGIALLGRATGTRELDALSPRHPRALERAIERAVRAVCAARGRPGAPGLAGDAA